MPTTPIATPRQQYQWILAKPSILFHTTFSWPSFRRMEYLITVYGSFMSNLQDRHQRVKIEDITSDKIIVTKGVPQGSVLGPLLFNIFLSDLLNFVKVAKMSNADDNQLYYSHQDPNIVEDSYY